MSDQDQTITPSEQEQGGHKRVESSEVDLPTINLTNPEIKNVVANLAKQAESMMRDDGTENPVDATEIRATIKVLAELDAVMAREKEALLDESPLKKLAQLAEGMNENNRQLVLTAIDAIKQGTFKKIEEISQDTQLSDKPLGLDEAKKVMLAAAEAHNFYELGGGSLHFTSLPELNNFLFSMFNIDLDAMMKNKQVWDAGTPRIDSKKIPGLVVSIYDRVGLLPQVSASEQEIKIDVILNIKSGNDKRPFKAAVTESFEEKKPKA